MFNIWIFLYFTLFGITTFFSLIESRFSAKKTYLIQGISSLFFLLLVAFLYKRYEQERFIQIYFFAVHLPCFLLTWLISKKRDIRILFMLAVTIMYCTFALQAISLMFIVTDGSYAAVWTTLIIITAFFALFNKIYFRPVFFLISDELKTLIGILTALLFICFFINVYVVPLQIADNFLINIVKIYLSMATIVTFVFICVIFSILWRKNETERGAELLSTQLDALKTKIAAIKDAEDQIRIERHDMRHRLKTIETLLYDGKKDEAIKYIASSEQHLNEIRSKRYCTNAFLDAVIAYYCTKAEKKGVIVKTHFALSEPLPADSAELSTALANALENAVREAAKCPPGSGTVWIKAISQPTLIIEIKNTLKTEPFFDENGLPVTAKKGHGTGSRSIAAFCKKTGASYSFSAEDGIFKLYICF